MQKGLWKASEAVAHQVMCIAGYRSRCSLHRPAVDLGVFLAGVQDIDDVDMRNSNAVHHDIVGMRDNLTRARDIAHTVEVGVFRER